MQRIVLNVPIPTVGPHCDVHLRGTVALPAFVGVYDRDADRWYTSPVFGHGELLPIALEAALAAVEVRHG
jgi:hypothetical protein